MAKYDEQFKLKVVQQYLLGDTSYHELASAQGVDRSLLRRWVASYRVHGRLGLARKLSRYSASFKLEVLHRARRDGLSDRQVAALYDIRSVGDIERWRRQYDEGGLGALAPRRKGRPAMPYKHPSELTHRPDEQRTQEELLQELAYLRAENAYLKKLKALIDAERTQAPVKKRNWSKD